MRGGAVKRGERIVARETGLPEAGIQGGGRTFIIAAVGGSCRMNPRTPAKALRALALQNPLRGFCLVLSIDRRGPWFMRHPPVNDIQNVWAASRPLRAAFPSRTRCCSSAPGSPAAARAPSAPGPLLPLAAPSSAMRIITGRASPAVGSATPTHDIRKGSRDG
jgi:hypothetical protein